MSESCPRTTLDNICEIKEEIEEVCEIKDRINVYDVQYNENLETQTGDNDLERNEDDSGQVRKQTKNKLVESCLKLNVNSVSYAVENKNENLVKGCPQTNSNNNYQAAEQFRTNVVQSCPKTAQDNHYEDERKENEKLAEPCPCPNFGQLSEMDKRVEKLAESGPNPNFGQVSKLKRDKVGSKQMQKHVDMEQQKKVSRCRNADSALKSY